MAGSGPGPRNQTLPCAAQCPLDGGFCSRSLEGEDHDGKHRCPRCGHEW